MCVNIPAEMNVWSSNLEIQKKKKQIGLIHMEMARKKERTELYAMAALNY